MRLPPTLLAFYSLLARASSSSINLSKFQEIAGFSFSCTDAYNTPLSGCTAADFDNGAACSQTCVTQLELVTDLINTACKGTKAYPNTLIGMFFTGKGVSTLCPNVDTTAPAPVVGGGGQGSSSATTASNSNSPSQQSSTVSSGKPSTISTTSAPSSTSALTALTSPSSTTASSSPSSSTTSASTSSSTSSSSTPSSTSTTKSSVMPTTVLPTLSSTASQSKPTTLTSAPASSTSSSTSGPKTTAGSGGDKGAVGPILGVTASSSRNCRSIGRVVAITVGLASFTLLV